jgi:hypothetical protein
MKKKALFLLMIILLNALAGFSCALRGDEDDDVKNNGVLINSDHHLDERSQTYISVDRRSSFSMPEKACCQNNFNQFSSLAKLIPQYHSGTVKPAVLYLNLPQTLYFKAVPSYILHSLAWLPVKDRPPAIATRIIIQSFQI